MSQPKAVNISFWIVTGLFCLWMAFTAFAQLKLPEVAEAFRVLGFPGYFRVELSWAKCLGIAALLFPVPFRIKEWAYAGFGIVCISAFIAHIAVGQGPAQWLWAPVAFILLAVSYILRQRIEVADRT
jgi:DoxX-like family